MAIASQDCADPLRGHPIVSMPDLLRVSQKQNKSLYTWSSRGKTEWMVGLEEEKMLMAAELPFSGVRISIQLSTGVVIVRSNSWRFWGFLVARGGLVHPFEFQKPRKRELHIRFATRGFHGCLRQRSQKLGPHPMRNS